MTLRDLTRSAAGGALSTGMARLNARHPWSHNDHFHRWILRNLPPRRGRALDVGCGRGGLAKHPRVSRAGPHPPPYPVQEPTTSYDDLRRQVEAVMPGARMRHRLGFRHTIAWTKPG